MKQMKFNTQAFRVFKHIQDYGFITRADALMDEGVANLPAVIEILRHQYGVDIVTEEVKSVNRYGQKITYAKYKLAENKDGSEEFSSQVSSENI